MANFYGPKGSNRWHTVPTMYGSGTITATRDSSNPSKINLHLTAKLSTRSGSTPSSCTSCRIVASDGWTSKYYELTSDYARTGSIDKTTSYTTNNKVTFYVHYYCCDKSTYNKPRCTSTDGDQHDVTMSGSVSVSAYNPETPATNARAGKIFSTNHTGGSQGGNISDKPDLEVWFSWTGATAGTPDSINGIKQYNIDINTSNSASGATSCSLTQEYTKNKHLSLFTLCREYGIRIGGTLYCWVNTKTKGGTWLRKSIFRLNYHEKRWFYKI